MKSLLISLLLAAGFSNILIGFLVLLRDHKRLNNLCFFFFTLAVGTWSLGIVGFQLTNDPQLAHFWAKVYYFAPLLISLTLLLFVRTFPNRQSIPKVWLFMSSAGCLGLVIPLLFVHDFLTAGLVYHDWGKEIVLNKTHYLLYSSYLLLGYGTAITYIYSRIKQLSGFYSSQAKLFFQGVLFTAVFGLTFNLIYPWFGNYRFIQIGPIFTAFVVIFIAYSIARHQMFNIRLVVARSMAYVLSLGLLIGTFPLLSSYVLRRSIGQEADNVASIALNTGILIVAILVYPSVKKFFDRVTNKIFFRDSYDPQTFLDDLNGTLVGNIEIGILLRHTALVIEENFKASCHIYLTSTETSPVRVMGVTKKEFETESFDFIRSELATINRKTVFVDELQEHYIDLEKALISNDISVISSLITSYEANNEATAYLILGPKRSGNAYSKQDLRIINIITDELLIAIQNALRFEEIQSFNITLQNRINDATVKLKRSNEKLKEMDETKDEFISMASHQLRTPLTSVKGYLSMVLDGDAGKVTETQQQLLNQAYVSSQRMVYLIADLLNVSRLKTGKFVINATPTNLADMVESELAQLIEVSKSHKLQLTFNKPENFPVLMLDETKTRQVVMNFVDNAIYYTPTGGKIKIELRTDRSSVYFMVKDNGLGVPKNEQSHLFTKFYRAKNAQKARPDGTGLGLFMAKKVVTDQGGTILFESVEGKGSTFGFKFDKPKEKVTVK